MAFGWTATAWILRVADGFNRRFSRWIMVVVCFIAVTVFVVLFGTTAYKDTVIARHAVTVTATVEDTAPYGSDTQYLLAFTIDGQADQQWAIDLPDRKVGQTVTVLVDRRDHERITSQWAYKVRWVLLALCGLGAAGFGALGVMFVRMDGDGFVEYARTRGGHI